MARISRKKQAPVTEQINIRIYDTGLYVRLSDEDIRKKLSDSIGTQKNMLFQYLQTQPDLQFYKIYEDINYTGTNFDRPAFARMLEDIQAGLVDCVLVKDLSRFGRSFEEMGHYLERVFPFLQVRFIAVNDGYDSLTATLDESSLIVPLKNLMNEVYARDISKKVQESVKLKQKRGEFSGPFAPYGYIKDGSSFTVDEETAPVVRQIFDWVLEGYSDVAIVQKLNELKILPPSRYLFEKGITKAKKHEEAKFWYKSTVKRITENPCYTGVLAQGKQQSNFLHGTGRTAKSREEWVVREDAHAAIVTKDIYEAVQKIREVRKKNHKESEGLLKENILKGLLFCADCKRSMARNRMPRAGEYYFVCSVYMEVDKHACTRKKVMEQDLFSALLAVIGREISLAGDMSRIIAGVRKEVSYQSQKNVLHKQIGELQKKLVQNRRYRSSLREDYIDGILTQQDYNAMKAAYDEEKKLLEKDLSLLTAEKQLYESTLSPENRWLSEFKRFENQEHLSRQMVFSLVERIEVYDNARLNIKLRYRDEYEKLREYVNGLGREAQAANA